VLKKEVPSWTPSEGRTPKGWFLPAPTPPPPPQKKNELLGGLHDTWTPD